MGPSKSSKKPKNQKKEKLFHPQSRKATQLVRTQLRKSKLGDLLKARYKKHGVQVDLYGFFFQAIPSEGALSLEDLHTIIRDIWLARYNDELEQEKAARRKGRPKSVREQKIEELKMREAEDYRTGLEVIDLTHPANVELFRRWDQKEAAFIQQLRFIRISSTTPNLVTVSRPGRHPSLVDALQNAMKSQDTTMEEDEEVPLLLEAPSRFASTIMTTDEPL